MCESDVANPIIALVVNWPHTVRVGASLATLLCTLEKYLPCILGNLSNGWSWLEFGIQLRYLWCFMTQICRTAHESEHRVYRPTNLQETAKPFSAHFEAQCTLRGTVSSVSIHSHLTSHGRHVDDDACAPSLHLTQDRLIGGAHAPQVVGIHAILQCIKSRTNLEHAERCIAS